MLKLLGSVFVAAGAVWLGQSAAVRLRRNLRGLEDVICGLSLLEGEMALSGGELEELMLRLSRRAPGKAGELFGAFGVSLSRLGEESTAGLWRAAVENLSDLSRGGKDILLSLGAFLGRFDVQAQCAAMGTVRGSLEQLRAREGEKCRENCRLYRALSLSGGGFLVILLI
jgi:stage III sporulation protein AB